MADIKLIDENTDLSKLRKPLGWDLEIKGVPYDIYRVEGYVHTIGGKYGENCYWACPMGEKPTYENLIEFGGEAPTWGVTFDKVNYIKSKWDETEVRSNGVCWITRNGKKFYQITGRDMDYALAKAQYYLVKLLEECPLYLSERNWKEQAIGRKIWYQNQPAIIKSVNDENELWIVPEGKPFNAPPDWEEWMGWEDYASGLRVELLSPHIGWFRD
ncbi:hypothetical protein [Cytobacillus praedii]|uniref:hypothetical protein n=1 Tax=Cytobacillus praedii TaxID=1742358 RepID=UPI002E240CAF|nr:hypothetical protein [Cytobacillus praedii]